MRLSLIIPVLFLNVPFSNFCADSYCKTTITYNTNLNDVVNDVVKVATLINLLNDHSQPCDSEKSSVYFDDFVQSNLVQIVLSTIICHKSKSHPKFAETVLKELWPKFDEKTYPLLLREVGNGYKNKFKHSNKLEELDKAMQLYELSYGIQNDSRPLINMSEVRYLQNDLKASAFYLAKANEISRLSDQDNKALEFTYSYINEDSSSICSQVPFRSTIRDIMQFEKSNLYTSDL